MRQYCRYCAELKNGDALYCEVKDRVLSDVQIKRANNCKCYVYCGFDENGFEHKPRQYKRKNKKDESSLF